MHKKLESIGSDVPWRKTYEYEAFNEPYWIAHNYSCAKVKFFNQKLKNNIIRY